MTNLENRFEPNLYKMSDDRDLNSLFWLRLKQLLQHGSFFHIPPFRPGHTFRSAEDVWICRQYGSVAVVWPTRGRCYQSDWQPCGEKKYPSYCCKTLSQSIQRNTLDIVRKAISQCSPVHVPAILRSASIEFGAAFRPGGDQTPQIKRISEYDERVKASQAQPTIFPRPSGVPIFLWSIQSNLNFMLQLPPFWGCLLCWIPGILVRRGLAIVKAREMHPRYK